MLAVQMAPTAYRIVHQVLAVKPGELVCIVTDTERSPKITELLAIVVKNAGGQPVTVTMEAREMGGMEPPAPVSAAMAAADAIIVQTTHSLTHTNAERHALARGARVCNIRGVTEDMMIRGGMTADYCEVRRVTEYLASLLTSAGEARVTTPEGTDLIMSLKGRPGHVLAGFATEPGLFSGLPDGEAAVAPLEGTTSGVIVNPYLIEKIGQVTEPLRIEVENGGISSITGGREALELDKIVAAKGSPGRNLAAELALGTNASCQLIPESREIKKKWGTAHVALGDNLTLGGVVEADLHLDIVFLKPTVALDGRLVVRDGRIITD